MSELSILSSAQTGMQRGLNGIKKNALNLASKSAMQAQTSPANDLLEMKSNQYQLLSSGKVVAAVDELLGSLLDEKS